MPRSRARSSSSSLPAPPRSKAGCWTCRIRRKRCDEQQDESGACQACVRLDIDCLGWGTRRPDWCRDKDKLAEYKLKLKKKLCTRAGTRPSATRHAQPSGLMASTSTTEPIDEKEEVESQVDEDEKDTGFEIFDNPESWQSTTFSPEFTLPTSIYTPAATSSKTALASLVPHLYSLTQPVPAAYRAILHQILDLHQYKSSICAAPDMVASRARDVEEALDRLARRAHFNSTFSSLTGFDFDPMAFLFDSHHQSPQTTTAAAGPAGGMFSPSSPFSPLSDSYTLLSPATTMWSPELVPDTLSSFSGSSAPTSPAVLGLTPIMPTSNLLSNVNDWFAGYDNQQMNFQSSSYMTPTPSTPAQQQQPSLDMLGLRLGLDGLGLGVDSASHVTNEEYLIFQNEHQTHPQISLFPPSPSHSKSLPSPNSTSSSPAASQLYSSPRTETENADPFGIHHKTCLLLLHTLVLGSPIHETERLLQDLTTQFSGLTTLAGCVEYVFAALLAGALSTSADRRNFFRDVVISIESSTSINVKAAGFAMGQCESLLCEAWNAC